MPPPLSTLLPPKLAHGKSLIGVCIFYGVSILSNFGDEIKQFLPVYTT
jgi:hypothetical protein